ncbi:GNAT family N-acetyltransferase [Polymorphospora sp. NPDC051019]|uniref:GNAT family N-acetyltransferase n=1 Tax=Polymorphospora sp. NPDC051019 TaxID=3155725 RepID=UPI00343A0276
MTTADHGTLRIPPHPQITGDGLHLREWTDDDLPALSELFDEPQVDRWTPLRSPFDLTAARKYLDKAFRARAEDRGLHLAITTDGRTPLGEVLLFQTGGGPDEAEVGYAVGAAHRRRGLARRAVTLLTGYAHRSLGMRRVVLRIDPANVASVAVAHSAGFAPTDEPPVTREAEGRTVSLRTWCHPG